MSIWPRVKGSNDPGNRAVLIALSDRGEFCVNAFSAVHPPTYVHINMVARLAECMTRHLISTKPELFVGFPGCEDVEDVRKNRRRIINYAFHSSLCHDLGKLFIIDTITMYGRNLLDSEFMTIKSFCSFVAMYEWVE